MPQHFIVDEPWAKVPLSLLDRQDATFSDVKLYVYLDGKAGRRGWWYGPQTEIIAATGLSERSIRYALHRLVEWGYVGMDRLGVEHGTVNKYLILARTIAVQEDGPTGSELPIADAKLQEVGQPIAGPTSSEIPQIEPQISHTRDSIGRALADLYSDVTSEPFSMRVNDYIVEASAAITSPDLRRIKEEIDGFRRNGGSCGWPWVRAVIGRVVADRRAGRDPWPVASGAGAAGGGFDRGASRARGVARGGTRADPPVESEYAHDF